MIQESKSILETKNIAAKINQINFMIFLRCLDLKVSRGSFRLKFLFY